MLGVHISVQDIAAGAANPDAGRSQENNMKAFIFTIVPIVLIAALSGCGGWRQPTDNELLVLFTTNRAEFEKAANMIIVDKAIWQVHLSYVGATGSPDKVLIKQYRNILRKIGMMDVTRNDNCMFGQEVAFTAYAGGALPDGGRYKGIAYFPNGLGASNSVVASLDGTDFPKDSFLFRKIDDNWYIYFMN